MFRISSWLTSPAVLRNADNAEQRDSDIRKERELYDYQRYEHVHQIITNKNPLPVVERPCIGWITRAVYAFATVKIGLLGADERLKALRDGVNEPPPRTVKERIKETSEVVSTMASVTSMINSGQVDEAASAVGNDIIRTTKHTGRKAAELLEDHEERKLIVPTDWNDGLDETVELYATRDYRAYVGLNRMTPLEAAYFEHFDSDQVFSRARVAGLNPMTLRRVHPEDMVGDKWKPTDDHLRNADDALQNDSLQEALGDNRLYMVDYKWLENAPDASDGSRFVFIPKALFVIPPDSEVCQTKPLIPVAIWAYRKGTPEADARIYTKHDGFSWQIAKLIICVLDGNDHEYFRHLIATHLLVEPFGISFKRNMHHTHPVYRLLKPHFYGTILINKQALKTLIAKDGPVDKNLIAPILEIAPVLGKQVESMRFNDLFLKKDLERRGVMDERLEFPYRDDAIALWDAISKWVMSYVELYYVDDASVVNDKELQAFASEVAGPVVGIKGFGEEIYLSGQSPFVISSRSYLAETLTMLIFTSSCQHAAMNFAQAPFLSYSPSWPLCLVQPELPYNGPQSSVVSWAEWRHWFPSLEQTGQQWFTNQLLGSVYYTRLGEYPPEITKASPQIAQSLKEFQNDLRIIGQRIDAREKQNTRENGKTGVKYTVLHPNNIPASINV